MYNYGPLIGTDSFPESPYEPHQRMWGIGHTKIGPRREMEVPYHSLLFSLNKRNIYKTPIHINHN